MDLDKILGFKIFEPMIRELEGVRPELEVVLNQEPVIAASYPQGVTWNAGSPNINVNRFSSFQVPHRLAYGFIGVGYIL